MLIITTNNRAIACLAPSDNVVKPLQSHRWTHQTSPRGWTPPSLISPVTVQRRLAYDNDSFCYIMKGAESVARTCSPATACRSAVLPVGGLQRTCRNYWFSSFWELADSGRTSLYMQRPEKMCFLWYGTFKGFCKCASRFHGNTWGLTNNWNKISHVSRLNPTLSNDLAMKRIF